MTKKEISNSIIKICTERIDSAELLFEAKNYADSLSRSYYAIFDIVRGMLELKGVFAKSHQGAFAKFYQLYIKEEIIDKKYALIFPKIEKDREEADYRFDRDISKNDASNALEDAKEFFSEVKKYLRTKYIK